MPTVTIDEKNYETEKNSTVLDVARANAIVIPTLCFHPALKPSGSCRLCAVEVETKTGRRMAMLSCILKVKDGLTVRTRGEVVNRARSKAFGKLIQMAPQSKVLRDLADAYGVDAGPPPDGCIRCRLCIRVCKEVVGPAALRMEKHNGKDRVVPIEGQCIGCGTCANLCPTDAIGVEDRENVRTIRIRDDIIGTHPLESCEGCGKRYATTRFLDHIGSRVTPHPDVKTHHHYCPTCAKIFSDRTLSFNDRKHRVPER